MNLRSTSAIAGGIAAIALLGMANMTPARAADNVRVRGTVVSLDGSTLTVKTREGPNSAVALQPGWKVTGVAAASVEYIKPGDFVGIASLPTAAGGDGAVEVLIFPAAMKGTGEGSYPWDLKPKSTMTNATVSNAVKDVDGRTLTLSYSGGQEKKISVPDVHAHRHLRSRDRGGPQARRDRLRSRQTWRGRRSRHRVRRRRREWGRAADVGRPHPQPLSRKRARGYFLLPFAGVLPI